MLRSLRAWTLPWPALSQQLQDSLPGSWPGMILGSRFLLTPIVLTPVLVTLNWNAAISVDPISVDPVVVIEGHNSLEKNVHCQAST